MKYIVRSLKYFVYLIVILTLIIVVLVLAGFVEGDLSKIFVNGYDSLWQIALMMAVFAAIYPRFGFSTCTARFYGTPEEADAALGDVMERLGYKLEKQDGESRCYIKRAPFARLVKLFEDRITVRHVAAGLELEGLNRDTVRIASGVESANREDA